MTTDSSCATGKNTNTPQHSTLLDTFLAQLTQGVEKTGLPILDLACGGGRNGLFLAKQQLPVVFADRSVDSLQAIAAHLNKGSALWPVDFEQQDDPLAAKQFSAVLVFRYLHRQLFAAIKQAIVPGGLIIYETFTLAQAQLGRPKNPNFLLKSGELSNQFAHWRVLHQFEGRINGSEIAQLVAVK
jgi:tellurite methyltransferase